MSKRKQELKGTFTLSFISCELYKPEKSDIHFEENKNFLLSSSGKIKRNR